MFESIIDWCNFSFAINRILKTELNGDIKYADPEINEAYRVDTVELITDKYGKEYASSTQLYIAPEITITINDMITLDNGKKQAIHKLGAFYNSTTKVKDIQVIYL